ncbi:ABC transporter ATP-binding protein [Verrucomicrobiota bacterium]
MSDTIISVERLSKKYRLGQIGATTLRESAERLWHKMRGRNPDHHMGVVGSGNKRGGDTDTPTLQYSNTPSQRDLWALRDVSFEVKRGEVLGIIGRNGAGKSTLLKILSRITEPTSGRAIMRGRVGSLLEVGTGFHPELTGRENVYLNGAILGMKKAEIMKKFDEIVAFAEIERFIDTPVKRYSSGMYVRLAFAVAAHLDPEILLVDEVLAVGDAGFQKKCFGKINEIAKQEKTVFLVSHNMSAIRRFCSRAIFLDEGGLLYNGKVDEVVGRYLSRNLVDQPVASQQDINIRLAGVMSDGMPSVRFNEIRIVNNEGRPCNRFDSTEDIRIVVAYQVHEPLRDLRIVVHLIDDDNVRILTTQNVDNEAWSKNERETPGLYEAVCTIPANTLGEKPLYVSVHLIYPKNEHLVLDKLFRLYIRYIGFNNVEYKKFEDVWIRPMFDWKRFQLEGRRDLQGES